jgi:four helix bundle protein
MNNYQFSFEKLDTWQDSRKLATEIYKSTQSFPADEKFGMIQQMRRAAVSICSNIAEGTTRMSAKDQAHFTVMSYSSLMELLNHLIIAGDMGYINPETLDGFRNRIQPLTIKLSNLRKSQVSRISGLKTIFYMIFAQHIFQSLQPLNP